MTWLHCLEHKSIMLHIRDAIPHGSFRNSILKNICQSYTNLNQWALAWRSPKTDGIKNNWCTYHSMQASFIAVELYFDREEMKSPLAWGVSYCTLNYPCRLWRNRDWLTMGYDSVLLGFLPRTKPIKAWEGSDWMITVLLTSTHG